MILLCLLAGLARGQQADSLLLLQRYRQYGAWLKMQDSMTLNSPQNLSMLHDMLQSIVEIDNQLLKLNPEALNRLQKEMPLYGQSSPKSEKHQNESQLLKQQLAALEKHNNRLTVVIIALGVAFILGMILLLNRINILQRKKGRIQELQEKLQVQIEAYDEMNQSYEESLQKHEKLLAKIRTLEQQLASASDHIEDMGKALYEEKEERSEIEKELKRLLGELGEV
ncbi:MAG: hypothetical protein K9G67_01215 [Bacteroidales bacterium]|nr:hypothetical protein [Bacteroidales bacterium]MCF8343605.1 hypothetical protein [Bacteroidales bacterium]MCF8374953.1 hypothetical protein [Bacteroidales bacterium]MCF8400068.1 hypothetical protein [Bacteroidales bacterium]